MALDPQLLEPVMYRGGDTGCLLVHGFTSAPTDVLPLAEYLYQEMDCTVHVPVLPGHCTSPEDLARYNERDWLAAVEQGMDLLGRHCRQVWLAGFSMGGILALVVAARRPVAGVISIAAPIWPKPFLTHLSGLLQHVKPWVPLGRRPRLPVPSWRYDRVAAKNISDLMRLIGLAKGELARVQVPVLVVQGVRDKTVRPASARYIYRRLGSTDKELAWVPDGGHLLLLEENRRQLCQRCGQFIQSRLGGKANGSSKACK